MNKPTDAYWQERFVLLTGTLLNKGERYNQDLVAEYEKAMLGIQRDIEIFYQRFADNNEVNLTEAKKMLNARELKEFKYTVEEYIQKGKENAIDQRWMKELENASTRVRLSRLESLRYQIRQQIEIATAKRLMGMTKLASELVEDGYYKSIFEIQKGFGIGDGFNVLNTEIVESIIFKPWAPDGSNFSDKIWRDRELLVNELQKALAQSFIRGDAPDKAISNIAKTMDTSRKAAGRLIMTESAFFANEARVKAFKELEVEEYQFLATLDMRTSETCQSMDLMIFKLSDREIGANWPPLHPWCRSTVVPHFEGNIKSRFARDPKTGKGYYVDGDMTYKDWYNKHVVGQYGKEESDIMRKKKTNEGADLEQYRRYGKVLGNDLGVKSFAEFQGMKYNDSKRWEDSKALYKDVNWQLKAQGNITKSEVHRVPFEATSNSVFDNYKNGVLDSRRYYGRTGKPRLDIDLSDHGNPGQHKIVPHQHNWLKNEDNHEDIRRQDDFQLTRAHIIANREILKGD